MFKIIIKLFSDEIRKDIIKYNIILKIFILLLFLSSSLILGYFATKIYINYSNITPQSVQDAHISYLVESANSQIVSIEEVEEFLNNFQVTLQSKKIDLEETQKMLEKTQKTLAELKSQKAELESIVEMDEALVNNLFSALYKRQARTNWINVVVGFISGVFASLVGAYIWEKIKIIQPKAKEIKNNTVKNSKVKNPRTSSKVKF